MNRIYSYVLRFDDGAAPNPFWGTCTLTICKPIIRRNARIGDWVIGTGSKNSKLKDGKKYDLTDSLVYAMKITKILSLEEYDQFCKNNLTEKIPSCNDKDWRKRLGDCIYNYSNKLPSLRKSVHNEHSIPRDLRGVNSLLSDEFYYFGEEPRMIPQHLTSIIKKYQGHRKIEDIDLVNDFESWINQFEKNKIYAEPQLAFNTKINSCMPQNSKCSNKIVSTKKKVVNTKSQSVFL